MRQVALGVELDGIAQHPLDGGVYLRFLAQGAIGKAAFAGFVQRDGFAEQGFLAAERRVDARGRDA